jgi:SAM-dependent methyltransferase
MKRSDSVAASVYHDRCAQSAEVEIGATLAQLVADGAGTLDIHEPGVSTPYTKSIRPSHRYVERELARVALHRGSLVPLLLDTVGRAERVLDVGCSTGGSTVALALSHELGASEIVGVDPNRRSLAAAAVRAREHDVDDTRCRFVHVGARDPLPFATESFDLTVCVSVLEYIQSVGQRRRLCREMQRVTRPGGHVLLVTPSPFRLRDYHTRRWFGDWRRQPGYPWASPPWQLETMLDECDWRWLGSQQLRIALSRWRIPDALVPPAFDSLSPLLPWQKILGRKRSA